MGRGSGFIEKTSSAVVPSVCFAAILVFAAAVRAIGLAHGDYYCDEASTALFAHVPFHAFFATVRDLDSNPPGFYLIAWLAAHLAGDAPWVAQLPSAVFGIATVALAAAIGRELGRSVWAGVIAAACAAVAPTAVLESYDARTYALLGLTAGVVTLVLVRGVARGRALPQVLVLGVAAAASAYAHYTGIVFCAVAFATAALEARFARATCMRLLAAAALAFALYAPWIPSLLVHARVGYPTLGSHAGWDLALTLLAVARYPMPTGSPAGVLVFSQCVEALGLYLWYAAAKARPDPQRDRRIALWAACAAVCVLVLVIRGAISSRYAFATFPLAWAAIGAICVRIFAAPGAAFRLPKGARGVATALFAAAFVFGCTYSAWADTRDASSLKSGVVAFGRTLPPGTRGVVLAAPDYLAPTVWYEFGSRPGLVLDAFARTDRPAWFRFSDGYLDVWTNPRAVERAVVRVERESAGQTLWIVTDPRRKNIGRVPYAKVNLLIERLERARIVTEDRLFPGTVESVRVLRLEPQRRVREAAGRAS